MSALNYQVIKLTILRSGMDKYGQIQALGCQIAMDVNSLLHLGVFGEH